MTHVIKAPHPKSSEIWDLFSTGDFIDGYQVPSNLSPSEAAKIAFAMPAWVGGLMRLRNAIVKPFGLKTGAENGHSEPLFPITFDGRDELVLGTDDRHLNFRISVLQKDGHIHMATWVHRNNWFGRLYLIVVMPFHILIVRNCLSRVGRTQVASSMG